MAKNRQPEAKPHDSSSSDDDEEAQSEEHIGQEDSETESESETEQQFAIKPHAPKKPEIPVKRLTADPISDSEESGSDSDTPPRRPDRSLKSISDPPKEDPEKGTKKPKMKATPGSPLPPKPTAVAKRAVDGDANGDRASKKAKKKDSDLALVEATPKKNGEDSKKQMFQRLFSEEDEIVLLEGLIEYKAKKGVDPISDLTGFHDFIKESLHVDVNKGQVSEKVRRFKRKLENNMTKGKDGKERKLTSAHEQKAFELSKKIWTIDANSAGVDNSKVVDAKSKKSGSKKANPNALASPIQSMEVTKMEVASDAGQALPQSQLPVPVSFGGSKTVEELILEDGLEIADGPKKLELQEKWKQLRAEEIRLYLKRVQLIQEQAELVLQALEGPGN